MKFSQLYFVFICILPLIGIREDPIFSLIPCNIKLVWVFDISYAMLGKVRFFQTLLFPTHSIKLCLRILLHPGFNENCACNLWLCTCKVISERLLTGIQQLRCFTWYIKLNFCMKFNKKSTQIAITIRWYHNFNFLFLKSNTAIKMQR